jgi:hypothetical protein
MEEYVWIYDTRQLFTLEILLVHISQAFSPVTAKPHFDQSFAPWGCLNLEDMTVMSCFSW